MRTLLGFAFAFVVASLASAQDAEQKSTTTVYSLTVRPNGAPVPSFRYELLSPSRDSVSNNAALMYHRAIHILNDNRPPAKEHYAQQEKLQKALEVPIKEFPKDEVRSYVKSTGMVVREIEAAAKCDRCDWGIDQRFATEGIGFLLPDVQKLRELAFLLNVHCRLAIADGKFETALRDIQLGFVIGRHAAQAPTLIHFLVGNAIATMFIGELERTLQIPECPNLYWSLTALPRPLVDIRKGIEGELRQMEALIPLPKDVEKGPMTPEDALAALDRLWDGIQKLADEPAKQGLAESRLGLAFYITMQHPSARKSLLAAGKTKAELDAMPPAQVVMLDALVRFRNMRDEHFVWFQAPYTEAVEGMRKSDEKLKSMRSEPFDYMQTLLLLLLPSVEKVYGAQVRTERRIASLRIVEAVRLYASKNGGRLPAKLSDVGVPIPVDPATNKAFEYSAEGDRFVISVPPPPGNAPDKSNHWKYAVTISK